MDKVLKDDQIVVENVKFKGGNKKLVIHADASLDNIYNAPYTPELLRSVLEKWETWQERDEIDVASSISSLAIAPQWYAALLAWGAWIIKKDGTEIHMSEFLDSRGRKNDIKSICIPLDIEKRTIAEAAVCRTPRDLPIVFAVAVVDFKNGNVKNARLTMTGAGNKSVLEIEKVNTLIGEKLTQSNIEKIKTQVLNEVQPKADFRGSVEYRKEMAAVLAERVLNECLKGAN